MFLSTSMGMGGADRSLLSAAQGLRARGHDVCIISLTPLGQMGIQAQNLGIATESLEMRRGYPDPRGLLQLARRIRAWKPHVLHSHMVHANLMARAVRVLARFPVLVSTIHNIYEGGRALMAGYRLTNGLADQMTIISEAAARRFIDEGIVPAKLLRVLPNGIDTDVPLLAANVREELRRSLGVSQEFAWIAVGRFEVAKDYPNMLAAFARVRERYPRTALLLVGKGSLQKETEAVVKSLGLEGHARFLGVRDDVSAVMGAADGYVMSSAWEGMPMVLLEAAAAGLPIVATRVGGNQEVVQDGESGFLVPPRQPDSLAEAMIRLMQYPDVQRRSMGERGRAHVRANYGLERIVERWEELYREVLARKGHPVPVQGGRAFRPG